MPPTPEERRRGLDAILGHLNFSSGKPEPRFARQVDDVMASLAALGAARPWEDLRNELRSRLHELHQTGDLFRAGDQVEHVLLLLFEKLLPAYRNHHSELLAHLSDAEVFTPFFIARAADGILAQGEPWEETDRVVAGALAGLNDFVGYRPAALVEARPRPEPYDHERVRPIPLYIRGAGVGSGPFQELVAKGLDILQHTDEEILSDCHLEVDLIDELAMDPRAYDQGHPVNRRPNYIYGEWDPHQIDPNGRFRRFVVRRILLDGLLDRIHQAAPQDAQQRLWEEAAVLAGTMLMAAGISGWGPGAHDSAASLATLIPVVARARDAFYRQLLASLEGEIGERLRQEAVERHQPMAAARQHLNDFLARDRAIQLQQRHLSLFFAQAGYPEESQRQAGRIRTLSVRVVSEIWSRLARVRGQIDQGRLKSALESLAGVEELFERGIGAGALGDPWNILGYQALFPLSPAQEDAVRDTRLDELVSMIAAWLEQMVAVISAAAATGEATLIGRALESLRYRAGWWDQFATIEIHDVRRVSGREAVNAAEHLASALSRWRERGETIADVAFWRKHLESFRSPESFAVVITVLLARKDFIASMGLLMNWLMQVDQVPLEAPAHSWHVLAVQWMLAVARNSKPDDTDSIPLVVKFFDYLEANADEYGQVPQWEINRDTDGDDESPFDAAYEEMTYRDSTGGDDGAISEGPAFSSGFPTDAEIESMERRLHFLSTEARLWQIGGFLFSQRPQRTIAEREVAGRWLQQASELEQRLLQLLGAVHQHALPATSGTYEATIEYDRCRSRKDRVLQMAIAACLDVHMAIGTLGGVIGSAESTGRADAWAAEAVNLEQSLWQADANEVQSALAGFVKSFRDEPLLFRMLEHHGNPREILRARIAQSVLRAIVVNLPRVGLLRETFHLLTLAREMEQNRPIDGRGVSEFANLFQAGYQAVIEAIVLSAADWADNEQTARSQVQLIERLTGPFVQTWVTHSQSLQLASLEVVRSDADWTTIREFIRTYGADLFQARFMTLGNLRGILHRGVEGYLDHLRDDADPLHPIQLIEDLDNRISRSEAIGILDLILRTLLEHYEEYKDYNSSTTLSDYGQNLHVLFEFLRIKVRYERATWHFRPLGMAHEVLARNGRDEAISLWTEAFERFSMTLAAQFLADLDQLESRHGIRLRTVRDRLTERFLRPLAIDRLRAMVGPLINEVNSSGPGECLTRFTSLLDQFTAHPVGVGLDVPAWLRDLELELERVRAAESPVGVLAEDLLRVPRRRLTPEDVRDQLDHWEKPID